MGKKTPHPKTRKYTKKAQALYLVFIILFSKAFYNLLIPKPKNSYYKLYYYTSYYNYTYPKVKRVLVHID